MHHHPRHLIATATLTLVALTGCTTMKAIETTGEELSQGNILSGIWSGTMGVAMGAIVDVFTLGGSMEAEDSAQMWTGAANQYAAAKQGGAATTYTPAPAVLAIEPVNHNPTSTYSPPQPTSTNLAYQSSTNSAPAANSDNPSSGANASHCLKLGRDQWNRLQFTNTCNQRVHYTYCFHGGTSTLFRCAGASNGSYGKGSDSVSAGGTHALPDSASASGAAWFGCVSDTSKAQPIPRLTSLNPSTGTCR